VLFGFICNSTQGAPTKEAHEAEAVLDGEERAIASAEIQVNRGHLAADARKGGAQMLAQQKSQVFMSALGPSNRPAMPSTCLAPLPFSRPCLKKSFLFRMRNWKGRTKNLEWPPESHETHSLPCSPVRAMNAH